MSQWKVKNGNAWEAIPAGGVGVPSGGTQGQVLVKASNADYDTEWGTDTSKVSKTGDTMTGTLHIRSSNIQDGTQSEVYGSGELALHDVNGVRFGYFLPMAINGSQGIQFSSVRTLLDGNNEPYDVYHGVSLYIGSDGTRSVFFSDPSAWKRALGLTYAVNDTESYSYLIIGGMLGSSAKAFYGSVYTPKSMENISTVTVTAMVGALRGVDGTIDSTTTSTDLKQTYTVTATKGSNNMVRITITKSSAYGNATTFTPAACSCSLTLKFT